MVGSLRRHDPDQVPAVGGSPGGRAGCRPGLIGGPPAVTARCTGNTEGGAPMTGPARIVIAGAGLAGLRTVEELRAGGYDGLVTRVGAEARGPYARPPLSKK